MPYTSVLFNTMIAGLAERLSDPAYQFWSQAELRSYLIEALRMWQVLSVSYNTRIQLDTSPNTLFYDLFQLVPSLKPTVTDRQVIRDIAFALQEPYNIATGQWIGTAQYPQVDVYTALSNRLDKFMLETGLVLYNTEVNGPTPTTTTLSLDESIMDVRSAFWKNDAGAYSLMWRFDAQTQASVPFIDLTPGTPYNFLTYPLAPLQMAVSPPPITGGQMNLLTTAGGPTLTPDTETILGVPDDFCWVLKFGALADLFGKEGQGQDRGRAAYCESRWHDGIALARITNFVHIGQNNGIPWYIDSLAELNYGMPGWLGTPGAPKVLALAGNMVATGPVADGVYSMNFDIMPKFPVPPSDTSPVQIGGEIVDVVLDYAQHLAVVKEGASEINGNMRQYQNMMALAAVQNDRLRAMAQNFDVLNNRSNRHKKEFLRRDSALQSKEIDFASN